jgi:phosphoribosylamine--glycine ligase
LESASAAGAKIFHAGTSDEGGRLVASGGRVLNVTASGGTIAEARERAYRALQAIDFPTGFYRSDIGWRELARLERRSPAAAGQEQASG